MMNDGMRKKSIQRGHDDKEQSDRCIGFKKGLVDQGHIECAGHPVLVDQQQGNREQSEKVDGAEMCR